MRKHGSIETRVGVDRRSRVFAVTPAGLAQLARARPDWRRAQEQLASALSPRDWRTLVRLIEDASLALHQRLSSQ